MNKRKRKSIKPLQHEGMIAIELSGIKEDNKVDLYKTLKKNPHVMMVHVRDSGHGVIIVKVEPVPQNGREHQKAFESCVQVIEPITEFFGIKIEPLGKHTNCIVEQVKINGENSYVWESPTPHSPYHIKNMEAIRKENAALSTPRKTS